MCKSCTCGTENSENRKKNGISFLGWPLWIAAGVCLLDQVSKIIVDCCCEISWHKTVIPGVFNLVHYRNTGGAWGIFSNHTWILALISLTALLLLAVFFKSQNDGSRLAAAALAILEGGIAGNMIDRFFRKSVVDFLDFHIGTSHWPAFNIADSAICIAIGLLLICSFLQSRSFKSKKVHE